MIKLGVNIDHVATVRQARKAAEPDPVQAAAVAELAGADTITVHLREDRRHINERDVRILRKTIRTKLNLEMSIALGIVKIACAVKPDQATLVPEKRKELTTEGGLDVVGSERKIKRVVKRLKSAGITVSLFIDPDTKQIEAASRARAEFIELHTGCYANAKKEKDKQKQLSLLAEAAFFAHTLGLRVNAGHGLNYCNTQALIEKVPHLEELNIGHSIVSRAVIVGLGRAVREMKGLINKKNRDKQ
ncbi:MAG: pyridoxine 5'-phosphate synthase [Candidatus Omnitrophica bacterium]|nr:pyridoxine 5'-phosphate synthase [Candidatus Omnitrophota bacterium]MBU1925456.1 pyridoxine 5'-phosphate synthase [Candidatus Omnitrophota bacterium]